MGGSAGGSDQNPSQLTDALSRLIGDPYDPNRNAWINAPVLTPEYGASKYYYVDPRAKSDRQRQQEYDDEQGRDDTDHGFAIDAVLRRLQPPPEQQQNIQF